MPEGQSPEYKRIAPSRKNEFLASVINRINRSSPRTFGDTIVTFSEIVDDGGTEDMSKTEAKKELHDQINEARQYLAAFQKTWGRNESEISQLLRLFGDEEQPPLVGLLREGRNANPRAGRQFDTSIGILIDASKKGISDPSFITESLISDAQIIRMIKEHRERIRRSNDSFHEKTPAYRKHFVEAFSRMVGELDIEANPELAKEVNNFTYTFADELLETDLDNESSFAGQFNADSATQIRISSGIPQPRIIGTFFHESLHALSGKAYLQVTTHEDEPTTIEEEEDWSSIPDDENVAIENQKVGLRHLDRFRWLNEAVTESLTKELVSRIPEQLQIDSWGRKIRTAYPAEQELLIKLASSGKTPIPLKLFYDAYFENFDPSLPQGQRVPKWKALIRAINGAYEPRFLVKLDKIVKEGKAKGVRDAIDFVQAHNEIPIPESP